MARPLMLATLLGASIGVPYVVSQQEQANSARAPQANPAVTQNVSSSKQSRTRQNPKPLVRFTGMKSAPGSSLYESRAPLEGIETHTINEVIRLDVTKHWVFSSWARKSTGLSDPKLFGIRVPLVTGTKIDDLAGSLAYYFDANGQVARLAFRGRTGDTTAMIQYLATQFGFHREKSEIPGEQLYIVGTIDSVESILRTQPAPVMWSTSPHNSFFIDLQLQRPGSKTLSLKEVRYYSARAGSTSER